MNIVKNKNASLNEEYKLGEEIKREHGNQEKAFVKLHRQVEVLNNDTYTANTRLLQMQRRILELEGAVGVPSQKFKWTIYTNVLVTFAFLVIKSTVILY